MISNESLIFFLFLKSHLNHFNLEELSLFKESPPVVQHLVNGKCLWYTKNDDKHCIKIYQPRGVFVDILKVFDMVCYEWNINKFQQNKIPRNLLKFLNDFLKDEKERVVLQCECWWLPRFYSRSSFFNNLCSSLSAILSYFLKTCLFFLPLKTQKLWVIILSEI